MNFRELIIQQIHHLLTDWLLIQDESQAVPGPNGTLVLTVNTHRGITVAPGQVDPIQSVLRGVDYGPVQELPIQNDIDVSAPMAFVSFDGGRNDLGIGTQLSHIVEVLSVRIEILLDKKIGVIGTNEYGIRTITLQAGDLVSDIAKLVTLSSLQTAVHQMETEVTVQDAILEEWEFDDRYRGQDQELLTMIFQAEVANLRQ